MNFNLSNGIVGYLFITEKPASFTIASSTAFVKPVNPGVLVLADPAPAAEVIGTLTRKHTEDLRVFNKYHSLDKACKKVHFTLVPEVYFQSFKNNYTGYPNVTCLDILTQLWTTYGVL